MHSLEGYGPYLDALFRQTERMTKKTDPHSVFARARERKQMRQEYRKACAKVEALSDNKGKTHRAYRGTKLGFRPTGRTTMKKVVRYSQVVNGKLRAFSV